MKVIVFKNNTEFKVVLSDGNKPKLVNWYERVSEIYDFANWASETYNTVVDVEFRR